MNRIVKVGYNNISDITVDASSNCGVFIDTIATDSDYSFPSSCDWSRWDYRMWQSCPKCGKCIECGDRYCRHCGKQLYKPKFCPHCGKEIT